MSISIPVIDEEGFPVGLGPVNGPAKTPSYGWRNWFDYEQKDIPEIIAAGEAGYASEWAQVTPQGHKDIADASVAAGISNLNGDMNRAGAMVAAKAAKEILLSRNPAELHVLDVCAGSGNTTVDMINAMKLELTSEQFEAVHFTLTDLSHNALCGEDDLENPKTAMGKLIQLGLKPWDDFNIYEGNDLEVLDLWLPENHYHIVRENAGIHHHGHKEKPFAARYRVTKPGGFYICSDWHNSMWVHPGNVLYLLRLIPDDRWPTKDRDIDRFLEAYPKAKHGRIKSKNPHEQAANDSIARFWLNYANLRKTPENNFFILEGHEPAPMYLDYMKNAGFETNIYREDALLDYINRSNPWYLLPGNDIGAITVGYKPISE